MNPLMTMWEPLASALAADPLLLLASAVATFDPYWAAFEDEEIDYEDDSLTIALQVTRGAFPDLYALAVERLRAGATFAEMDRLLGSAISAKGIPLDDLDTIGWGVPLTAVGIDLEDPECYAAHDELLPILALFGIDFTDRETYRVEVPEAVYAAGRTIAASLLALAEAALQQVGWLFGWLFGCTGNSLIDWTDDTLSEIPPLSWSPDEIEFAIELIGEANTIMRDAQAGLAFLKSSPHLLAALERNIVYLYRELKQKGKLDERDAHVEWTGAVGSTDGTAVADAVVLQLRSNAA